MIVRVTPYASGSGYVYPANYELYQLVQRAYCDLVELRDKLRGLGFETGEVTEAIRCFLNGTLPRRDGVNVEPIESSGQYTIAPLEGWRLRVGSRRIATIWG